MMKKHKLGLMSEEILLSRYYPSEALDSVFGELESPTLSYFLRAVKKRPDLAMSLLGAQLESVTPESRDRDLLEKIRNALAMGHLVEARTLLEQSKGKVRTESEESEFSLEWVRLHVFENHFEEAIRLGFQARMKLQFSAVSEMTLAQLLGHALIEVGNLPAAIEELQKSTLLFRIYPSGSSGYSALMFLIIAYCKNGSLEEARRELLNAETLLSQMARDEEWLDRLMQKFRVEAVLHRKQENHQAAGECLVQAKIIAEWLNDTITFKKCQKDLMALGDHWPDRELMRAKGIYRYPLWTYLTQYRLLLIYEPKVIKIVHPSPVIEKLLFHLSQGPQDADVLFESVWGIRYHKERHDGVLRKALSALRKVIPRECVHTTDRKVSLT